MQLWNIIHNMETSDNAQRSARLIPRAKLLETLFSHKDTDDIKVLTGVRRCGKSTLLQMYADKLVLQGIPEQNVFIKRFDSFDIPIGYSADDLHKDLQEATARTLPNHPFYVFLDEIQDIPNWETVVRKVHTRPKTDVYITGSNSRLLSSDLSTYLTGRYAEIPVYPLSFSEYMEYRSFVEEATSSQAAALRDYMKYGGMPGLLKYGLPNAEYAREILHAIFDSVVVKDVAEHNGIRDMASLNKLSRYLFSTTGTLFSVRSVSNTLKNAGTPVDPKTVDAQIQALEQAYVIYHAEQVGIGGKQVLRPSNKYYPVDNGFRNMANNFRQGDFGAQLEGVVFMELKRRGYEIQVGDNGQEEVDFVVTRGDEKAYIQVTLSMLEDSTRERELRPLLKLVDAFPRVVITLDEYSAGITAEGVRIVNAVSWLLDEQE